MRISTIVSCLIFIACIFAVYAAQANEAYNDEGEYIIVEPVASDEVWIYDSDTLEAEVIEPTDTYEYGDSTEIDVESFLHRLSVFVFTARGELRVDRFPPVV